MISAYPIRLAPIYKDAIWGGTHIAEMFQRETSLPRVAESWEVSDRPQGMSQVMNGPFKGLSLNELALSMKGALFGENKNFSSFPLLIKILDATKTLSVQVHPNDETALLVGAEAKSEMWYVLDAEPGAMVYAGFEKDMTPENFLQSASSGDIVPLLRKIEVQTGDAIYIPGGCVHAIGEGCLIFEVQQNSHTTYRIYDWDRKEEDGKARELHLDNALSVIDWSSRPEKVVKNSLTISSLIETKYFKTKIVEIFGHWELFPTRSSFQIIFCLSGNADIEIDRSKEPLSLGLTYLIPASFKSGKINGNCKIIIVML